MTDLHTYLTFDVGTTAIKTCLFDEKLQVLAQCTDEYDLLTANGLVELDSDVYWRTICRAVEKLGKQTSLDGVKTISITTQGETMIPVDRDGKALCNAIVWLDGRAEEQAKKILEKYSLRELYDRTGISDMNGFVPLAKLMWLKEHAQDVYQTAYKVLLLEDFLIMKLTGKFVTESALQASTGWYDNHTDRYLENILQTLELNADLLPEILDCGKIVAPILPDVAQKLGLPADVQIVSGAMDQTAAAVGGGGLKDGIITATIGTALVLTVIVPEDLYLEEPVIYYRGVKAGQFFLLPLCNAAGIVFKWLKDTTFQKEAEQCKTDGQDIYDYLCNLAKDAPAGANGLTVLPYFNGSIQPTVLPQAKGVFFGLTLNTSKGELVRAVLEGIAYMFRENIDMLKQLGVDIKQIHFFGGGSKNPIWNQIIADVTGVELVLLEQKECASVGAAMLAAVAIGDYPDLETAQLQNRIQTVVRPDPDRMRVYEELYQKYLKLFRSVEGLF